MSTGRIILLMFALVVVTGCEDFLNVDLPKSRLATVKVFESDDTAIAALSGVYLEMIGNGDSFSAGYIYGISNIGGIASDELTNYFVDTYTNLNDIYKNEILSQNLSVQKVWTSCYKIIYFANSLLEGIDASPQLTPSVKAQLEGEATFIRAFCHFYLVNVFGDVPLVKTTDYRINKNIGRTPTDEVYADIVADLKRAKELLSNDYIVTEKVRVNKAAVTALLARVYLYIEDWTNAEIQSSIVLTSGLYSLATPGNVFLANSSEAIWQLEHPVFPKSTNDGNIFVLRNGPGSNNNPVALSDTLYNSFEPGDLRKTNWIGAFVGNPTFYFPNKYKNRHVSTNTTTEYAMVLRLAEQYLIRAESRAHLNKLAEAIDDVDKVRNRAQLPLIKNTNAGISMSDLLLAIEQERKVEFFAEWGHRWFDLKRTNRATIVLDGIKLNWDATDALFPIPESEILINPRLKPQNPGY